VTGMLALLHLASFLPPWVDEQPFLVTGLALGGVYALSGVGLIVLFRTTGVLNLSFGAVGAFGALIAWQLINHSGMNEWLAYLVCVLFAGVVTLAYGMVFGRALADRDPLVKATASLGLTLLLLGAMDLLWTSSGGASRAITLPTDNHGFTIGEVLVSTTDVIGLAVGVVITVTTTVFLRYSRLGTAMRAMASDREITATLGVPVARVEACAWFGCGVLAGIAGILLADLVALDATTLTFLVISSIAATLIARLSSIAITFLAAIVIGVVESMVVPIESLTSYADATPFVLAVIALLVLSRTRALSGARQGF
jgi:branched-chain amino acid transport system permease protein